MAPSGSATAARLSQVAALAGRVGRAARVARVISRVRMLGNDSRRGLGAGARARLGRYPHFLGSFGNFHGLLCGFVLFCASDSASWVVEGWCRIDRKSVV